MFKLSFELQIATRRWAVGAQVPGLDDFVRDRVMAHIDASMSAEGCGRYMTVSDLLYELRMERSPATVAQCAALLKELGIEPKLMNGMRQYRIAKRARPLGY